MKKLITQFAFIVLTVSMVLISDVRAATINATSCSRSDVQSAINSASDGDLVVIPSGSCIWTTQIILKKNITLQGAGKDKTHITWNTLGFAFYPSGTWRISGIDFAIGNSASGIVYGDGVINWRIDHCKFSSSGFAKESILVIGQPSARGYGLMDNNEYINVRSALFYGGDCNPSINVAWTDDIGLGTDNAIFVEDSTITNTISYASYNAIDENCGGRIVFRHNTITDWWPEVHSDQGGNRAARSWEFYNNTIQQVNFPMWCGASFRGGSGVVYNNTLVGQFGQSGFLLDNVRSCEDRAGLCDGTTARDGNRPGKSGYPCRDQIGRSTDEFQWKEGIPPQDLCPAYFWNNKNGINDFSAIVRDNCALQLTHIVENRDFYNYNASFDGTTGVGMGLLANRPATCTTNTSEEGGGVAYWAMDTNTLYRCRATNTWTVHYQPYTFPHPLRKSFPPQNLRITATNVRRDSL